MPEKNTYSFLIDEESGGERIDSYLSEQIPELSRSRIQKAIRGGDLSVGGELVRKPSRKVQSGETVRLTFSPPRPMEASPEEIALDIVHEDEGLLVVNKPAGMVVHPAPGNERGTLVNALLSHCGNLSGIGGVSSAGGRTFVSTQKRSYLLVT